jgi:ketosteroid isomerase-like protein
MGTTDALERRILKLEDTLALHDLTVEYGLAADAGDREALSEMFTDDAVYELEDLRLEGREQIVTTILTQRGNPSVVASAHTMGPVVVTVFGDRGFARGYSRLYVRQDDDSVILWRLSFNRWEFARVANGCWRIARRVTRLVGENSAPSLLRR